MRYTDIHNNLTEGETLREGMWIVKSADGVPKGFKDPNSEQAKQWAASMRNKPKTTAVDKEARKAAYAEAKEHCARVCSMAIMSADGWGEIDRTDVIKMHIVPFLTKHYRQNPDAFTGRFYDALKEAQGPFGSYFGLKPFLDAGAKLQGYSSFDRYANDKESYTGEAVEEDDKPLIPQDQQADFKDDILAKDKDGKPHDPTYIDRLMQLAGQAK